MAEKFAAEIEAFRKFKARANKANESEKALDTRIGTIEKGTEAFEDAAQIGLRITVLEKLSEDLQANRSTFEDLSKEAAQFVTNHRDFAAESDEVKTVTDLLSKSRMLNAERVIMAKDQLIKAKKKLADAEKSFEAIDTAWAKVDGEIDQSEKMARAMQNSMNQLLADAKRALSASNRADLAEAQKVARGTKPLMGDSDTELKASLAKVQKQAAQNPMEIVRLKAQFADAATRIAEIGKLQEGTGKVRTQLLAMSIKTDVRKVAATLGVTSSSVFPKLEKALDLDDAGMARALEDALKAAGKPMKGKDAVDKLKKAHLI